MPVIMMRHKKFHCQKGKNEPCPKRPRCSLKPPGHDPEMRLERRGSSCRLNVVSLRAEPAFLYVIKGPVWAFEFEVFDQHDVETVADRISSDGAISAMR